MLPIQFRALSARQFAVLLYAKEIQKGVKTFGKNFSVWHPESLWVQWTPLLWLSYSYVYSTICPIMAQHFRSLYLPQTFHNPSIHSDEDRVIAGNLGFGSFYGENLTFINLLDTKFSCKKYRWRINMVKLTATVTEAVPNSLQFWSLGEILLLLWWRILGLMSSALRLLKLTCSSRLMIMLGFSSLRSPASLDPECYCARQHPVWRGFWFLFLWQCHQFMRPEKRSGNASRGGHDCNRTKSMKHLCFFVEYQTMSK